jgi:hypothetical protein
MATRAVSKARTDWCYQQLVQCRPTSKITAELAEREGISRRQARDYVGRAYLELAADLQDPQIENTQYLAKMITALETTIEQGVQQGHGNAVIGATRLLSELLALGAEYNHNARPGRYGRSHL